MNMLGYLRNKTEDRINGFRELGYGSLVSFTVKLFLVISIFMVFCPVAIGGVDISAAFLFVLYQLIFILLPGFVLVLVFDNKSRSNINFFGVAYLYGWIFNLLLYIIAITTDIISIISAAGFTLILIILCIAFTFILPCEEKKYNIIRDIYGERVVIAVVMILCLLYFVIYTGNSGIPYKSSYSALFTDAEYWIGNTIELTKEFPPHNFRDYTKSYNYHYFSSMQLALVTMVTGIRPIVVGTMLEYLEPAILLATAYYALITKLSLNKKTVIPIMIIAMFSTGLEDLTNTTIAWHYYISPYGSDYGMGLLVWGLILCMEFHDEDKFHIKTLIKLMIMSLVLIGTKAPAGVVLIGVIGVVCIINIFRKNVRSGLIVGILIMLVFAVSYLFIVNVSGYSGQGLVAYLKRYAGNEAYNNLPGSYGRTYSAIRNSGHSVILKIPAVIVLSFVFHAINNPVIFILEMQAVLLLFEKKVGEELLSYGIVTLLFLFNLISMCVTMTGLSNRFFSIYSIPLGICLFLYVTRYGDGDSRSKNLIPLALIGCVLMLFTASDGGLIEPIHSGIKRMVSNGEVYMYKKRTLISNGQLTGMEYIRNLPGDKIITNADTQLAVYTEKYIIQDRDLKTVFKDTESQDAVVDTDLIKKKLDYKLIDYIIIDKNRDAETELSINCVSELYEDDDYIVYEIVL